MEREDRVQRGGCRWPCDLHPARALGCGSGSRHTAYRRPLFGAGIGDRDGLGIDRAGRDTEDRATRPEVRMAVRTVAAVPPPLWKLYSQRIGKLRPALRCLKTMHVPRELIATRSALKQSIGGSLCSMESRRRRS